MNKAITEGLDLMPPAFIDGLDAWSSGDGTPGSTTYDNDPNGTLVASDPDFGPCIEIIKADDPQQLRHTGETPILPGCYLEVTARVKLIAGPFPQVRIAAYAGDTDGSSLESVVNTLGPQISLDQYGRVYTVRAIVGSGDRTGVDLVWGTRPVFGHFGIDILGDNGAVVRVESISVEDKTSVFHRKLMDWVDVRDYGAVGDGVTDDADAFLTADAAADGRDLIIPEGTYFIGRGLTLLSRARFEGTIVQAIDDRFVLRGNFDYPSYVEAFGDETLAFKKGLQALFGFADHESFDLGGRRIQLDEPVDVRALNPTLNNVGNRRAIRNGQLEATDSAGWDPSSVVSTATYAGSGAATLTNVVNVASIEVGSLVEGFGVGRDVYVRSRDVDNQTLTLSQSLGKAQPSQEYTFTRFRYLLDFSGMPRINRFNIDDIEFLGNARANGVMLPDAGIAWSIRDCWFTRPRTRAITSIGRACQGISIDRNQFAAADSDLLVKDRVSTCFNINANDAKIRDNRSEQFRHFAIINGSGNLIVGNHFWQLDSDPQGERTAGLVFTRLTSKSTVTGNYIDTMTIELSPEHRTDTVAQQGFDDIGQLTITGNIFTAQFVPSWFTYIIVRPPGTGYKLQGLSVTANTFQQFNGAFLDRVESVDTTNGDLDHTQTEELAFHSNTFRRVGIRAESPAYVDYTQGSLDDAWTVNVSDKLPFGGRAMTVQSVVPHGRIADSSNNAVFDQPYVETEVGNDGGSVRLNWSRSVSGTVRMIVRSDNPV